MATLRVSGMASGIDVDTIVKQMMTAKRIPLDKLTQKKQVMEWQRDNFRDVNSKLVDFKTSKLTTYQRSAAMNTQIATVSGETASLKAEATAEANIGSMNIVVTQIAKPATATTAGATMTKSDGTRLTSSSTLADLQKLNTSTTSSSAYNITVNNISISLSSSLSISEAIIKINSTTAVNATAKFDEITGKLSIESKNYSSSGTLTLSSNDTFQKLFGGISGAISTYQPAIIKVDSTGLTFASNSFKLNGVNLTLLSESTTAAKVTTSNDPTKALESIKSFVSDYNSLLSSLNTKVNEERYKDFTPLTDEQKEAMNESQIEAWETKAKSGLLKNDQILKSTISSMRTAISEKLGQLSQYGITTGQYYENGKLYIDEDKLKQALTDNPQAVTTIFQGGSDSSTGLISKLSTLMTNEIEKMSIKAGTSKFSSDVTVTFKTDSTMGKELADYKKRISTLQDRLDDYENNLYKRFTAMETAISNYNSQSSSLASYMKS
ncbi:flagellar filament capping protein FliD [Paenibacillus sp. FSL H7-0350]|uniref:flagellar filament capping protein FliD n=1 Tax=Paenibacillus sp. FSL H7-0350 TaxID=2975345 RepID=UPI0031591593